KFRILNQTWKMVTGGCLRRDYQQVLAELGFMYSTKVTGGAIEVTPCGLHLLDNKNELRDILTNQVLLYQYPNGGKRDYADDQINNGVLLRPAVLVWRVIMLLSKKGSLPYVRSSEIRDFLMRCCNHNDAEACADAIILARHSTSSIASNDLRNAGRNAADWITLLDSTLLFKQTNLNGRVLGFSEYSQDNLDILDELIFSLEKKDTFWNPSYIDEEIRRDWYAYYGALRFEIELPANEIGLDIAETEETEEQTLTVQGFGSVALKNFDPGRLNFHNESRSKRFGTIESSYDAGMIANQHRLHDSMVILIASVCKSKGAEVFEDAKSIDLLVRYHDIEYIIEVKTITSKNYVKRLRYAVGQLLQYDFLLESEFSNRRKVLATPSTLTTHTQFVPFVTNYLDFDLLTLSPTSAGQRLLCTSNHTTSTELFSY
ncbi:MULTISPECIES: hypothetical protein, partial [Bacteroidota]